MTFIESTRRSKMGPNGASRALQRISGGSRLIPEGFSGISESFRGTKSSQGHFMEVPGGFMWRYCEITEAIQAVRTGVT